MDSLVLRPTPGPWRLGLNFLVGTFAVALLTMCAYGADEPPFDTSVVNIGLSLFAFLAILTALAVRNYFAATLRLSREPGRRRTSTVTRDECEQDGLSSRPMFLSVRYDTRGHGRGLYEILQHGRGRRHVAAHRPA